MKTYTMNGPSLIALLCWAALASCSQKRDAEKIVEQVSPSVVKIETFGASDLLLSGGTGFIVSEDGEILTNYHVLENASRAMAKCPDGGYYAISHIISYDKERDLIRAKLEAEKEFPFLKKGNSANTPVGAKIFVVGSPLGLENTISEGIVSAKRHWDGYIQPLLQITAPISPGSSGSPVIDDEGRVIGVATFNLKGGQNVNFAVPIEDYDDLEYAFLPFQDFGSNAMYSDPEYIEAMKLHKKSPPSIAILPIATSLVEKYPHNFECHFLFGTALFELELYEEAKSCFLNALRINP